MKKTCFTLFFILLFFDQGYGQVISNIDFNTIEKEIKDSSSAFYYPSLIARLLDNDTTLTSEDFTHLYYGNVYDTSAYSPYGESDLEEAFLKTYDAKNFEEAIPEGKKVLQKNPINIKVTFKVLVCYHKLGRKSMATLYAKRYYGLLGAIYNSGDGKSVETAYVVIKVNDEYQVLGDIGLTNTSQALLTRGPTDLLTIDTKAQKKVKGKKKIKEIYFNIEKPFDYLAKQFEKKD